MNVLIRHNGNDITGHVIRYTREHRICNGIGTLDIEVNRTSGIEFQTWDNIDIYENGEFKVRYFVSGYSDQVPAGIISVKCQDNSKRLVDYFISSSYTIEEPSYTRYWIEKFLNDAGVNYSFTTSSNGNLLSNFTSLGLTTAYEQIIQLLQLSGWYIYFDGNGKAIIGSFNKNLSPVDAKITEEDILSISVVQDDKMLRNRAVVIGAYNPITSGYASADVSVITPYNYDSRDLRSIVITNSNIPNSSSAYGMANQLVKEFANITVEKHIELHGARDYNLGDVINVQSRAFRGKGVITSYAVTMDSSGLVTTIVLDERCPRLFGFFNFGDYVYVSTFGSGIWRKHIQYDHTWRSFSQGLDQPAITDLHIANGLFTAVGTSGEMYYNLADDTPWTKFEVDSLLSVSPSGITVLSGESSTKNIYDYEYSGIMGRATILDRTNAIALYAVDNASGINYGDYYITLSSILFSHQYIDYSDYLYSGAIWSGGRTPNRGWVIEKNLVNGAQKEYPIHVSGNYNIKVFDIETDGRNDYISVYTHSGNSLVNNLIHQDYGYEDSTYSSFTPHTNPFIVGLGGKNHPNEDFQFRYMPGSPRRYGHYYYSSNTMMVDQRVFNGELFFDILFFPLSDPLSLEVGGIWVTEDGNFPINFYYQIPGENPLPDAIPYVYKVDPLKYNVYMWSAYLNELTKFTVDFYTNTVTSGEVIYKGGADMWSANRWYQDPIRIGNVLYIFYHEQNVEQNLESPLTPHLVTSPATTQGFIIAVDLRHDSVVEKELFTFTTPQIQEGLYWRGGMEKWFGAPPNVVVGPLSICGIYPDRNNRLRIMGIIPLVVDELNGEWPNYRRTIKIYAVDSFIDDVYFIEVASFTINHELEEPLNPYSYEVGDATGFLLISKKRGCILVSKRYGAANGPILFIDRTIFFLGAEDNLPLYAPVNVRTDFGEYGIRLDSTGKLVKYRFTNEVIEELSPPQGYESVIRCYLDVISGTLDTVYVECSKIINDVESRGFIIPYSISKNKWYPEYGFYIPYNTDVSLFNQYTRTSNRNTGSWFITLNNSTNKAVYGYLVPENAVSAYSKFLLLKKLRGDDVFTVLDEADAPFRIDISQFAPILSNNDKYTSFNTFYEFGSGISVYSPVPDAEDAIHGEFVNDYRYTLLPDISGGLVKQGIYLAGYTLESRWVDALFSGAVLLSGIDETNQIRTFNVDTYSGVENALNIGYSGILNNIETTNYAIGGQYIFVTTSGDNPRFYQMDPHEVSFNYYSGLPSPRVTMIRVDDRI